jgi:hypothetical protein
MITTTRDSFKSRISRERLSFWLVGMLGAIRTTSFYYGVLLDDTLKRGALPSYTRGKARPKCY